MRTNQLRREYSLDFAKIIATTLILFLHFFQSYGGDYTFIKYYGGKFYFGNIVELFFMLSGFFTLHLIYKAENFPGFIGRRLSRLWPVMIIAAIMDQVILIAYEIMRGGGEVFSGREISMWGTIISAFGVQNIGVFFNQFVNNPTWYISVLILCYMIAYFFYYISEKSRIPVVYFYVGMILLGASTITRNWNAPLLNNATGRGYTAFFTGICLYMLCEKYQIHRKKPVIFGTLIFTIVFWLLFAFKYEAVEKDQQFLCIFVVWPSLILLLRTRLASRLFSHPIFGILGNIAFDTYIWHANVLKCFSIVAITFGITDKLYTRNILILFAAVSWMIGVLSYYFLEKPIVKRIDKYRIKMERLSKS